MKISVSKKSSLIALLIILLPLAAYFLIPTVQDTVHTVAYILTVNDTHEAILAFKEYLLGFGFWAPAVSAVLMVFQSVIAPIPAFVLTFTNGLMFGWAWGALLSWTSSMLGAALCFWIARSLGRPMVEKLVGGSKTLEISDAFFARYGNRAVLISRLLPFISFDIISYGAGLTPITFWKFLVATGLGQLPATLVYSYLGQNLTGSMQALFWVFSITAAIFVLGWTLGPIIMKRLNLTKNHSHNHIEKRTESI